MTLEEIDTYEGDGCFIVPSGKSKLIDLGKKVLFENDMFDRFDLDRTFGNKQRYDNHQNLININWCVGYIPIICTGHKLSKSGKSTKTQFIDRSGPFEILTNGKFKANNQWLEVDYHFEKGKAYILKCESNPFYPEELRIIAFKELKK